MTAPDQLGETVVSGPLEELRAARAAMADLHEPLWQARERLIRAVDALLAASGTGERPADEQPAGLLTGIGPKFPSGAATIIAWANGGTIEGPDLVKELAAWLAYFGGAPTPTPPAIQLATPPDAGTGTPSDDGRREGHTCEVEALGDHAPCVACDRSVTCPECKHLWTSHATGAALHRCLAPTGTLDAYGAPEHLCRCLRSASAASLAWQEERLIASHRPTPAAPSGTTGADSRDES